MKHNISLLHTVLTWLVLSHFAITILHGVAHARAGVILSRSAMLFVVTVILIGPLLGLIVRLALPRVGTWAIALTLAAALTFGMVNHFLISGDDHVSHVAGPWRAMFGITAMLLVATETAGSATALWCARRARTTS